MLIIALALAAAQTPAPTPAATPTAPAPEKKYCRTEQTTGSIMPGKRTCLTKSEWKAITAAHGRILERVGCHHVVFPEAEMGSRVAHLLAGSLLEYLALDEYFALVEMTVPQSLDGLRLAESGLRAKYEVTVVCIKKHGKHFTYATPDTLLSAGDLIVVAGDRAHVQRFAAVR